MGFTSAGPVSPDPYRAALIQLLLAKPLKGHPGTIEALYVVHFADLANPNQFRNGGVVVLETERVFGGDGGYYYTGTYKAGGNSLRVNATITQHNPGWSVWGDEAQEFDIEFVGRRHEGGALIEGTMRRLDKLSEPLPVRWFRMAALP